MNKYMQATTQRPMNLLLVRNLSVAQFLTGENIDGFSTKVAIH